MTIKFLPDAGILVPISPAIEAWHGLSGPHPCIAALTILGFGQEDGGSDSLLLDGRVFYQLLVSGEGAWVPAEDVTFDEGEARDLFEDVDDEDVDDDEEEE